MTTQPTPSSPSDSNPMPVQQQQSFDWRQLDFAADGLVLRTTPAPKR